MKLEGRQVIDTPLAQAWQRIVDPRVLRACTPGLDKLDARDADHYEAVLEVRMPAITGRFEGTLEFLERVPPERLKLRLAGKGAVGFVDGEVTLTLAAVDEGTSIAYSADVQVGGQVARLGQRLISGVTREMAGQFFSAFERWRPEAPEEKVAAPPARSLFQLLWRTLLRLLGLRRDT
ncbi:MAG: carbon monoxide dehydrogenase subunit G [Myxococcota bacterium]